MYNNLSIVFQLTVRLHHGIFWLCQKIFGKKLKNQLSHWRQWMATQTALFVVSVKRSIQK